MTTYTYSRRSPGACKAKIPTRGADCGLTLGNSIALYTRPVMVHSGPTPMRMTETRDIPYPFPWVRLDTAVGVPTRLDEASFWARHPKGTLDVSMRLVGLYQMRTTLGGAIETSDDPATRTSIAPVLLRVELCQYVSGTAPTVIALAEIKQDVTCYPNVKTPWYPLLSLLALGTNDYGSAGYDRNLCNLGSGGVLRVGQFYPADLGILQRVRLSLDFNANSWAPDFATARERPMFARVTCIEDTTGVYTLDPLASATPEHFRIFNVASEMRLRGRI